MAWYKTMLGLGGRKLTEKDLEIIRISVLKQLGGDINNPEFINNALEKLGADMDRATPDELPEDMSDMTGHSPAYRHLFLLMIKTGDHFSNLFKYEGDIDYVRAEHLAYRNGRVYGVKHRNKVEIVTGTVDKDTNILTVTGTNMNSLKKRTFRFKEYATLRNNYQGIGDLWLLWDIMRFISQEYQELQINSLLSRERLAISGLGEKGQKMIDNLIHALYSGTPILNFENIDIVDRVLKGLSDKSGKIGFENRIEKLVMSYKFANDMLDKYSYTPYNNSSHKKERVNSAETNMENIYVDSLLESRFYYRELFCKEIKERLGITITVKINPTVQGKDIIGAMVKDKEKGKE